MEKGSFHSVPLDSTFDHSRPEGFIEDHPKITSPLKPQRNSEVENIPLPSTVPSKIDLANLPQHLLRSATIDSLVQQNEDLMVRLNIHLRKNADLEDEIQTLKDQSADLIHELDRLRDELLIYKEKDRLFTHRTQNTQNEIQELRENIQFLETQYAELYSTSKHKQNELTQRNQSLRVQLVRYHNYRKSVQKASRNLKIERQKLLEEISSRQQALESLQSENEKDKAHLRDFQVRLGEAADRIQYLNRQAKEDQNRLVEDYERQLSEVREELENAHKEIARLQLVEKQLDTLREEEVIWQNQKVHLERILQSERESHGKQTRELQEALTGFRHETKEKTLEVHRLNEDLESLKTENNALKEERQALSEQVESLQCLWRDNQNQMGKMQSQVENLQKLNQQLSQQLNQLRKENLELRNKNETTEFQAQDRIRELNSQVKVLGEQKTKLDKEEIKRIETLLAEIQSGFKLS